MHAGRNTDDHWEAFSSVRKFLQRWGLIADGASETDVTDLGIGIEKVIDDANTFFTVFCGSRAQAFRRYLCSHAT